MTDVLGRKEIFAADYITTGGWSDAGFSVVWPNKYISSPFIGLFEFCIVLWSQKQSDWNRLVNSVHVARGWHPEGQVDVSPVDLLGNNPDLFLRNIFQSVCFQWIWALLLTPKSSYNTIKLWPNYSMPLEEGCNQSGPVRVLPGTLARVIKKRCML